MNYLFSLRNQLVFSASVAGLSTFLSQSYCVSKQKSYYFQYGTHMIPHPQKVHKGGEDALYAEKYLVAVADGVGGWADMGIDPGLYSKELCQKLEEAYKKAPQDVANPKKLIIAAAKQTKAIGSSTVCVLSLDDKILKASLVGDSGYAIYRRTDNHFDLIFKSKEQQKSFNFPYQIGSEGDPPTCATEEEHTVKLHDLIILGTDGLFDNLSAQQIKLVLDDAHKNGEQTDPQVLAKLIANYTYRLSLDTKYNSPFAAAAKLSRLYYVGGKSDDITIIVAQIKE